MEWGNLRELFDIDGRKLMSIIIVVDKMLNISSDSPVFLYSKFAVDSSFNAGS